MPLFDGASGTTSKANVDSNYNLQVNTTLSGIQAGFVVAEVQTDAGVVMGTPTYRKLDVSYDGRLRVGIDTPLFNDRLAGTSQNTANYNTATNVMTVVQASGYVTLNANNSTNNSAYATIQTYKTFPSVLPFGTKAYILAALTQTPASGNITEFGFGLVNTNSAPSDGVFFRFSGNSLQAVENNTGTETISGISTSLTPSGTFHQFEIGWHGGSTVFRIDNNIVTSMPMSTNSGTSVGYDYPTASNDLPLFMRTYNYGAGPTIAQQLKVSNVAVFTVDANTWKPWPSIINGMGGSASQGQNGMTMGSTASWTNTTNPIANSGLNTTALMGSGIGGFYMWSGIIVCNNISAAGNQDYIICDYQIPTGSNTVPGKSLYVHGVNVQAINLQPSGTWSGNSTSLMTLAYGHTSESLATIESANTKIPRIVPLGTLYFPSGSATNYSGTNPYNPPPIVFPFTAPVVVNPGEYLSFNSRFLGSSGVFANILYDIGVDGYWE